MEDTSSLELFLAIASYIGTFPCGNVCKKFWGFYVCCWCLLSVFLNIAGVIFEIRNRERYSFYILPIMVYVQWLLLDVQCSRNAFNHAGKWKKILSDFSHYEDMSPNVSKRSHVSIYLFILAVVAINLSFILIDPSGFTHPLNLGFLLKICWIFHSNLIAIIYALILKILKLLEERYKEIREEIATLHRRSVMPNDQLRNLKERYRILHEISTSIDEIFGGIMLIQIANTFSLSIDLIGLTLTVKLENATCATMMYYIHCIAIVACAVYIVSHYDSLERIGKEIVKFCCIHEVFNGISIVSIVKYFNELSPRFSANGYFPLNNTMLPSLLAGIATYVVVMLQLRPN